MYQGSDENVRAAEKDADISEQHGKSTEELTQLKGRLRSHLHKLQKLPAQIIKYFQHPFIAYAA